MKDAPILILDDALSAVDTDTEEQLLRNLQENRRGKTTILIAHRISTIQHADVILVLEEGRAEEVGNHTRLMEQKGIYYEMFEKQQLEAAMGEQRAALHREYQDEPHLSEQEAGNMPPAGVDQEPGRAVKPQGQEICREGSGSEEGGITQHVSEKDRATGKEAE